MPSCQRKKYLNVTCSSYTGDIIESADRISIHKKWVRSKMKRHIITCGRVLRYDDQQQVSPLEIQFFALRGQLIIHLTLFLYRNTIPNFWYLGPIQDSIFTNAETQTLRKAFSSLSVIIKFRYTELSLCFYWTPDANNSSIAKGIGFSWF